MVSRSSRFLALSILDANFDRLFGERLSLVDGAKCDAAESRPIGAAG